MFCPQTPQHNPLLQLFSVWKPKQTWASIVAASFSARLRIVVLHQAFKGWTPQVEAEAVPLAVEPGGLGDSLVEVAEHAVSVPSFLRCPVADSPVG